MELIPLLEFNHQQIDLLAMILCRITRAYNLSFCRWQTLLNFSSQRRLLLTGTPLQNHLMELWSLMHFLMPHVFQSHREFKEWFSNPLGGMIEGTQEYNEGIVRRLHKVSPIPFPSSHILYKVIYARRAKIILILYAHSDWPCVLWCQVTRASSEIRRLQQAQGVQFPPHTRDKWASLNLTPNFMLPVVLLCEKV